MINPINYRGLKCPPAMVPHVGRVLEGEYYLPFKIQSPIVIDVGANVGSFTVWCKMQWADAIIHSYEPGPETYDLLVENTKLFEGIRTYNFAIGDPSHTKLYRGANNCGERGFFDLGEQKEAYDEVVTEPPSVLPAGDILKIDTEGCEYEILSGLDPMQYQYIMLEYHSEELRVKIRNLLSGFKLFFEREYTSSRGISKYVRG